MVWRTPLVPNQRAAAATPGGRVSLLLIISFAELRGTRGPPVQPERSSGTKSKRRSAKPRFFTTAKLSAACRDWKTQSLDQLVQFVFAARDKRERNDETFVDHHQRALPHVQLASWLIEVSADQLPGTDGKFVGLVDDFESALLGQFDDWAEIVGCSF